MQSVNLAAFTSETVDVGGLDIGAIAADVGVAEVCEDEWWATWEVRGSPPARMIRKLGRLSGTGRLSDMLRS